MVGLVNYAKEPHSVELREIPVPEIGEEDVLFKVQAVGICGSDLHQYTGKQSWKVNYPVVLGHEFAGSIAKLGSRVHGFKEGDRVVSETAALLPPDSALIRQGLYNLEPKRLGFGYGVNGAMAPFVKVPARCLHHVPASLALEKAALTEPCCVAYNAVCVNSRLRPGDTVAVIGPGPIGLLCATMAKLSGAGHLIVIGTPVDAKRLEVAKQIGADTVLGAQGEDVAEWVKNFGDGYGCRPSHRCRWRFRVAQACARYCPSGRSNYQGGVGTTTARFFARSTCSEGGHSSGQLFSQLADLGEGPFALVQRQD